ncbi:MAG: Citrate synthase (si), partial [uncultured Corynebacteriales bacterium]
GQDDMHHPIPGRGDAHVGGLQGGPRGRRRLRDRDRRTGQGRQRAALPRRGHRGSRRQGRVRQRLGAAGRREVQPGPAAGGAVPDPGALRRHPGGRAERDRDDGAVLGARAVHRHRRRAGPRRPGPHLGDRDVVRGAVRPRPGAAGGAAEGDRHREDDRRAVHDPLARRAGPGARQGGRRVLRLRRRARPQRLHLHRPDRRLHRRRRRGRDLRRDRRAVRPAARRRAVPGAEDARRRRALRRPGRLRQGPAGPQGAADGLRAPGLPGRGPARPYAPPHRPGAGLPPGRGGRGAGEGRDRGADRALPGPPAADERRVLVRGGAGLRRGAAAHVHLDVHLRPDRRVERAHHGAEAAEQAGPAVRALPGRRPAQARGGRGLPDDGPGVQDPGRL